MATVAFDTLKFARTLQDKAKLTVEQAEGIAEAFADATGEQLATKADTVALAAATRADLRELGADMKTDMAETKSEIHKWMFGQTLLILGAVIALGRFGH